MNTTIESLLGKIKELQERSSDLEFSQKDRDEALGQVHAYATEFLDAIHHTNAYSQAPSNPELMRLDGKKKDLNELLRIYKEEVARKGINPASGGHLGYIPGGGIYASALGDYLADVTNEFSGMHFASPGAAQMEDSVIDWLKDLFGFPGSAVGNLTSGGSIANLIALVAARDQHEIKGEKIMKSVIYLSAQAHHSIQKALRIIGLSDAILREVKLDGGFRMDPKSLAKLIRSDIEEGFHPFMVISAAGSTDTGAVDPMDSIGRICKNHGLWFHVDAAYGGFFILIDSKREMFKGIEMADSLVVDPHKGLFMPYGIGVVLVKDKKAVMQSHHYVANYMQDAVKEDEVVNAADVSPELTKHFRGLRAWLPLQYHGIEPFKACLEEKIMLTEYFRQRLIEMGFRVGPEPDLSVSYFYFPSGGDENQFNQDLLDLIHKDGRVFLSSTLIEGQFLIRIAILAFRTKLDTVNRALEMISQALEKLR